MKTKIFLTILMVLCGVIPAFAVDVAPQADPQTAATQVAPKPAAKMIFDYQAELGLTDKQIADLKKLITDLQTTLTTNTNDINNLRKDLSTLITDKKEMKDIRSKRQKIANLQVDNFCLDLETARKIEGILSADQIKKWQDIRANLQKELTAPKQP